MVDLRAAQNHSAGHVHLDLPRGFRGPTSSSAVDVGRVPLTRDYESEDVGVVPNSDTHVGHPQDRLGMLEARRVGCHATLTALLPAPTEGHGAENAPRNDGDEQVPDVDERHETRAV